MVTIKADSQLSIHREMLWFVPGISHFTRDDICSKGSLLNRHDYKKMTSPLWKQNCWKQNWILVDFSQETYIKWQPENLYPWCLLITANGGTSANGRRHLIATCGWWIATQPYCTVSFFFLHFKFFSVVYTVSSSHSPTAPLRARLHHCLYSIKGPGIFLKLFLCKAFAAASRKLSCSNNKILAHQLSH